MIDETTINARWCVDSESGEQWLLDVRTGRVLGRKDGCGIWVNPEENGNDSPRQ